MYLPMLCLFAVTMLDPIPELLAAFVFWGLRSKLNAVAHKADLMQHE